MGDSNKKIKALKLLSFIAFLMIAFKITSDAVNSWTESPIVTSG